MSHRERIMNEQREQVQKTIQKLTTVNFQWFLYRKGEARAFSLCICHPGMPLAAHQSSQAMYRPLSTWHVELALFRRGTGWTKSHAAQAFHMAVL